MGCVGHAAVVAAAPARSQSQLATGLRFQWSSHSSHYSNGLQSHYLHTSAAHAEFINSRGGKNHRGNGSSGGRRDNADKRRGAKEFDSDSVGDGGAEEGGSQQKRDPPPVFEFSFDPADQQVFLKTGTVSAENIATVRAEIKAHSDFSDELKLVDKTTHSVELYFLRVVAVNLARNPHMTVEELGVFPSFALSSSTASTCASLSSSTTSLSPPTFVAFPFPLAMFFLNTLSSA